MDAITNPITGQDWIVSWIRNSLPGTKEVSRNMISSVPPTVLILTTDVVFVRSTRH